MHFCGFCGKGPFSASSSLKKHIQNSVKCNEAKRQEWDEYATKIWNNTPAAPGPPNFELHHPVLPPVLEEDDLQDLENYNEIGDQMGGEQDNPPDIEIPPDLRGHHGVTVEDVDEEDKDHSTSFYIKDFPEDLGVGAVWGEDVPFFEKLRREQEENGSSQWGPFADQEEWELAMWLIRNVGHNQIDAFSNLNIVGSNRFVKVENDRSLI
jgi:hypothetical protein